MVTKRRISIYIDGNNLYRGAKELGFHIDYQKFYGWLRQKYSVQKIFLCIGLVPSRAKFYTHLKDCGFLLIFKQAISVSGIIKGNCDAELVLHTVSGFYRKEFDTCILITGDGDFSCLVKFLAEHSSFDRLLVPDKQKCSFLLRNQDVKITFLNDHYHKFSRK